ncbi:hypothetical protein N8134_03515 [Flavobacteriales bacterium]|nr:hypothetical protein [Flavobacteriales bacterium]
MATRMCGLRSIGMLLVVCALASSGCRPEPEVSFELQGLEVTPGFADKDRLKTNEQWVAIVHTNLFQTGMPANDLYNVARVFESIGDQSIAREVLLSNFFNQPDLTLTPTDEMLADPDAFIDATYLRFYTRFPTQAERTFVREFILNNPGMTPELVYMSFGLSEEYRYY